MPALKEYNQKIKTLKNTQKITKTMKMVSASKLRKAHQAQSNAKLYAQNLTALTSRITASVESTSHPLLVAKPTIKKILILVFTSNKGLCGAFNHNAHRAMTSWLATNRNQYDQIDVSCYGKQGFVFFQKKMTIKKYYEHVNDEPQFSDAITIGKDLAQWYQDGAYDEVYLVYNQFFSPLSQKSIFEKILPIDPAAMIDEKNTKSCNYIFEPEVSELLEFLIPHFLYFKIYFAMLENWAGEHGARMTAMDNATRNAAEFIDTYTLLRNRARQAAITTELTEIVAGAEAL